MGTLAGFYRQMWQDAADRLGATMIDLANGFWRVEQGDRSTLIHNYIVQIDDPVTLNLAGDKVLCHQLLAAHGVRVPDHTAFTLPTIDRATSFMSKFPGSSFVVKPASGTSGARGVTTHITDAGECRRAAALASLYGSQLLIERWIPGESYRLLFLDGEMIHASRRRGLRVVGDGRSTVAQLVQAAAPSLDSAARGCRLDLELTLAAQALTLESIVALHRTILAQSTRAPITDRVEIRTVFDEDATALIGRQLHDQAADAVRVIGSRFAGVDVITLDPSRSLQDTGGVVNEINTTPGLHHHYGLEGTGSQTPPAVRVLMRLLEAPDANDMSNAVSEESACSVLKGGGR
jgi:cyanophycin synthetase